MDPIEQQPRPMTELDERLREMALTNWNQFASLLGEEAIRNAKICLLRRQKASYGQISLKLKIPLHQARYACDNCDS